MMNINDGEKLFLYLGAASLLLLRDIPGYEGFSLEEAALFFLAHLDIQGEF
jgi:hypothetical protein